MSFIKRKFSRSEIILLALFVLAVIAVSIRWQDVKQGFINGWKQYGIEQWFDH